MLPEWLCRVLGIETADGDSHVVGPLQDDWPWPAWLTLIFVVGCIALVVYCYRSESGNAKLRIRFLLACLRLGAIGMLLLMIAQWSIAPYRTGLPSLAILIDDSASMDTVDRPDDTAAHADITDRIQRAGFDRPTRLAMAKTLLIEDDGKLIEELAARYRLKFYLISETTRVQNTANLDEIHAMLETLSAGGQASRLGDALGSVVADFGPTPPAAIVLFSDGTITAGRPLSEAALDAQRKQIRVYSVALGSEKPIRDVELSELDVDDIVFLNETVAFDVTLTARGLEGQSATVTLRASGNKETLNSQQVDLPPDDQPLRLRLTHQPTVAGSVEYEVQVETLPEEAAADNNRRTRRVEVRDAVFKVLLVQSYPSFEFRYLKEMLKRDPKVRLDYVLQEADLDFTEVDAEGRTIVLESFPTRREELFAYDVVIYGDVDPALLGNIALQNLADFVVENGGGLIFVAGPRFMPREYAATALSPLMPFAPENAVVPDASDPITDGFTVEVTPIGLASPQMQLGDSDAQTEQIWRELPAMYFAIDPGPLKPAARVLGVASDRLTANGKPLPVFIAQYLGAGQVVFHGSDDTWRWRRQMGDTYFARYWKQSIRALSRTKLVGQDRTAELTVSPPAVAHGRPVQLRVRFYDERKAPASDDGVTLLLEANGQPRRQVALHRSNGGRGLFEAAISPMADGLHRAVVVEPALPSKLSAEFNVLPPQGETDRLAVDAVELRSAATATGGKSYRFHTVGDLLSDLGPAKPVATERLPRVSLWNWWPLIAMLVVLLASEWTIRKRSGML